MPNAVVWDNDPDDIAPVPLQPALDIFDVARLLKCSHMTVRRMIADGRLAAVKVGANWRIRPEVVAAYLRGGAAS